MIDTPIAHHLVVLGTMRRGCIWRIEVVGHAHAVDALLCDPVDTTWSLDVGGIEQRRQDVYHVMILSTHFALRANAMWPRNYEAVANTTQRRGDLLHPWEGRVESQRPADWIGFIGFGATHDIEMLREPISLRLGCRGL